MRSLIPTNPLLNESITGTSPVQSEAMSVAYMSAVDVTFLVIVGAGLTATFNILVSRDGVNFYDSGQILPSVAGSAKTFICEYSGGFPYVLMQVTPSTGTGNVEITGTAKGSC